MLRTSSTDFVCPVFTSGVQYSLWASSVHHSGRPVFASGIQHRLRVSSMCSGCPVFASGVQYLLRASSTDLVYPCYTLNTTGSEYGYGPGRRVLETRHTVLGQHTKTRQPTASGLGLGQPTLRHQEIPGPSTGADRDSPSAAVEPRCRRPGARGDTAAPHCQET